MGDLFGAAADLLGSVANDQGFHDNAHQHEEQVNHLGRARLHVHCVEGESAQSGGRADELIETR